MLPDRSSDLTPEAIERATQAMLGWLFQMPAIDVATCEALSEVHGDDWRAMAEVTIRAYMGQPDPRPFTYFERVKGV